MRIALAGNPNCGKTALYNTLTGKTEHVGNWAGVTVDKKEARLKRSLSSGKERSEIIDLPGAYSMSPFTGEESITSEFIQKESPDVIINVVDATQLNRGLFFTSQIKELGIPMIIALNKSDLCRSKGISIDTEQLSRIMGCPVVNTVSIRLWKNGIPELVEAANSVAGNKGRESAYTRPENPQEAEKQDKERFDDVTTIVKLIEVRDINSAEPTIHDKVDKFVASKWLGIPLFAGVIWLVFTISQSWIGPFLADTFVGWLDALHGVVDGALAGKVHPFLQSLVSDGIIGGVGAVVGFLPLIMVLFFLLALLEDCGYMARVAMIMDPVMKRIGLSGKSIIPMVISTGCAIPGIMSTRTIRNERQRRTTAMLTPFMPCGAKLPIIALFAGVFFGDKAWVGTSMYFLSIGVIIIGGLIIRKITGDNSKSYFIMELPEYRMPSVKRAALSMLKRARSFIIKAGTVILVCNTIVHILQTFNWQFQVVSDSAPGTSILATLASPLTLIFIPLGFGLWQFAASTITGFIAKENVVGTLAVTFAITNFIDVEELALIGGSGSVMTVFGISAAAALSYLVFNLFTPPCFAAIGAMNSELESKKWLFGALGFQLGVGYVLAFLVYQIGTLLTTGAPGNGLSGGAVAVVIILGIITFMMIKGSRKASRSDKVMAKEAA